MAEHVQKTCDLGSRASDKGTSVSPDVRYVKRYQEAMAVLGKNAPETGYIQRVNKFKKVPVSTSQMCCLKNA